MVFESLINPFKAKKHPGYLFLIGILFVILAVIFSLWIFKSEASMVMILLVVLMSVPLMYATNCEEEKEDLKRKTEGSILKQHSKAILFLTFLFFGFVIGFSLVYIFTPTSLVTSLFNTQQAAIENVNSQISGNIISSQALLGILANNTKVLIFCIFFALFFGAGAIFILAWNASVIATAIGSFFRERIAEYAMTSGLTQLYTYFHIYALGILRYMTHGVFEITAYFIGGLAGGILSVGLIRHGIRNKNFTKILNDVIILIVISIAILILAAIIEVFVTPNIF